MIHHDKEQFISERQDCFNIQKSNIIFRLKKKENLHDILI